MYNDSYSYDKSLASTSSSMRSRSPTASDASISTVYITSMGLRYSSSASYRAADISSYMVDDSSKANISAVYIEASSEEARANDRIRDIYVGVIYRKTRPLVYGSHRSSRLRKV